MAHCYVCGLPVPADREHPRRKVPVGEWKRRDVGAASGWTVKSHMGMRIVCAGCAYRIDRRERDAARAWLVKVALSFAAMLSVLAWELIGGR